MLAATQVDVLMLDTTYCLPRHTFPPQEEAIGLMIQVRGRLQCRVSLVGRSTSRFMHWLVHR